jgi:uncharacterized protein (TIGR03435 family)
MSQKLKLALAVCAALSAGALRAQTPAAPLEFEVASIKPAPQITPALVASGKIHAGMKVDAARVDIGMFSLMDLICKAYDVKQYQVSGPPWLTAQRFDIVAKLPEGGTKEQVPQMLQALLADRFKLAIHRSTKEQSVYGLVVGKGGPKLKQAEPDANPTPTDGATGSNQVTFTAGRGGAVVSDGEGGQTKMTMSPETKSMRLEMSKTTMAKFAEGLSRFVDRPVVDMTELKGNYQVVLDLSIQDLLNVARSAGMAVPNAPPAATGDAARPADAASDPGGGSIFTSVQALGLKLDARKAPIEQIVVDRVEKTPTEN